MGPTVVLPNAADRKWGKGLEVSDGEDLEHTTESSQKSSFPVIASVVAGDGTCLESILQLAGVFSDSFDLFCVGWGVVRHRKVVEHWEGAERQKYSERQSG